MGKNYGPLAECKIHMNIGVFLFKKRTVKVIFNLFNKGSVITTQEVSILVNSVTDKIKPEVSVSVLGTSSGLLTNWHMSRAK